MRLNSIFIITLIINISLSLPIIDKESITLHKNSNMFNTILSSLNNIKNKIFNFFEKNIFFLHTDNYKNITFKSIIGFSNQKAELSLFINNIKKNKQNKIFSFVGHEGMQKIQFAYALANASKLPLAIIELTGEIETNWSDKKYIDHILGFLRRNSPCIIYIENIESLWQNGNLKYQAEIISYIKSKIKKVEGVTFIFSNNNIFPFNQLLGESLGCKTIMFDFIEKNDSIALIKFYLNEYNLILENDYLIENLNNLFENMTVDDIANNIENLSLILSNKNQKIVTNEFITELSIEIEKNKKKIEKANNLTENNGINPTEFVKDKNLDDIWGYKSIKNKLLKLIPNMQDKNKKQKGILFTGPVGVGKTQMVRALAGSSGIRFITVNPAKLLTQSGDNIGWNIFSLFERAKSASPCILFIDEIDILLDNKIANSSFLIELDGNEELLGVTVIGATNYSDRIDYRMKRPGRMSLEIKVPLPNKDDRSEMIKNYLKNINIENLEESILNQLIERTINFSGADIKEYIYNIKTYLEENNLNEITSNILFNVYIEMILGSKKNLLINNKEEIQVAYHEACHGLLQYILYREKLAAMNFSFLTIEPHDNALGVACNIGDEYYKSYTKTYLESDIKISLAGKCGQEIFLKTSDSGAMSDLQTATTLAYQYVDKFGLGKRLAVKRHFVRYEEENSKIIISEVEALLQKEYALVRKFLTSYKNLVDTIVKELLQKKLLHREELDIIINEYEKINKKIVI